MADKLLSDIIQLENDIQQQLKSEEKRAATWLERVLSEEDARLARVCRDLETGDREALETARMQAEQAAEAIEEREAKYCRMLESVSDEELLEVVRRSLMRILPGSADDHQDVQN